MKTIESIANSSPNSSPTKRGFFSKIKTSSASINQQSVGAKSAALRLAAIASAVTAGVMGYESLRSFDWFQSVESAVGIALAVPALLAATKLIKGFEFWKTSKRELAGLILSAPFAALWLSHYQAGGAVGYDLVQALKGLLFDNYSAAMLTAAIGGVLAAAPFAPNMVRLSDMLGDVFAALYNAKKKQAEPVVLQGDEDQESAVTVDQLPEPGDSGRELMLRSWLDANNFESIEIVGFSAGNSVDTFELKLPTGLRAKAIIEGKEDISRHFSGDAVRVLPVIRGKQTIAIEIEKTNRRFVDWETLRNSTEFSAIVSAGGLPVIIGQSESGANIIRDLRALYHMLVAGRTGSGKSVSLNSIILGLAQLPPSKLKMLMIDPKRVELAPYASLPHLISKPLTELKQASYALNSMCDHMESRYAAFEKAGARNIEEYNALCDQKGKEKLPYIVIIADEFGDMVLEEIAESRGRKADDEQDRLTFKQAIAKLTQKARAAGIYLILATQRPDKNVVDGLIKANVITRICYQVADALNSRIILDKTGAELLPDMGACLLKTPDSNTLLNVQGANIKTDRVKLEIDILTRKYKKAA